MNNREAMQKAFEAWASDYSGEFDFSTTPHGTYIDHPTYCAFIGFRAALASQAQKEPTDELKEMEVRKDAAYLERNQVVAALAKCFPSGTAKTAIEGWSEDWHGCVYIDLPTGQASWHYHDSQAYLFADMPAYMGKWDGHTTDEKYSRLGKLQSQAQQTESQWISVGKRLPEVAKNDYSYFLVALTVHGTGQRVVFEAAYLNELMLQNNDDNLEEDELPFSGWYVEIERDGDNLYEPIMHGTVTHWMVRPLPPAPEGGDK